MTLTEGVDLLMDVIGCRRKGYAADYDTRSMLLVQMVWLRPGTVSPCGILGNILRVLERYIEGGGSKLGLEGAETPVIPAEADAPYADYVLQGVGVEVWRRLRRVRRVSWWFVSAGPGRKIA